MSEALLAGLGGLVLAVPMTWPAALHPASTVPEDLGDPLLETWQVAWGGHALVHQPLHLFDSNTFWPLRNTLAFSDSLLGYAPTGLAGSGPPAALVRYNLLFVSAFALAAAAAYVLARQLGCRPAGAAVAGVVNAYAPWRIAQAGHLHILSTGGIALALALLARGHGVGGLPGCHRHEERAEPEPGHGVGGLPRAARRPQPADARAPASASPVAAPAPCAPAAASPVAAPAPCAPAAASPVAAPRRRPGWAFAGWCVAAWQLTLGFGLGLAFAYLLALVVAVAVVRWLRGGRPGLGRRLLVADVGGLLVLAVAGLAMGRPYLAAVHDHPEARRDVATVALFSPPWQGLLTAPAQDALWGPRQPGLRADLAYPPEMTLAPGLTAVALAGLGTAAGRWSRRRRGLLAGTAVVTAVLALGTRVVGGGRFTYLLLYHHLPGWQGVRTPGRLVWLTTLALALLAASGADRLRALLAARTAGGRPSRRMPAAVAVAVLMPALALAEGVSTVPHPRPVAEPVALRSRAGPLMVLPSTDVADDTATFWSTDGFPDLVNGSSGFTPAGLALVRTAVAGFPDAASVSVLRAQGVRRVVLVRSELPGTPWQGADTRRSTGLGLSRRDEGDAVVYDLVG